MSDSDFIFPEGEENLMVANAEVLAIELKWLEDLVQRRVQNINKAENSTRVFMHNAGQYPDCYYTRLIRQFDLSEHDRFLLLCAITPHIMPEVFSRRCLSGSRIKDAGLGGYILQNPLCFLPTLQTVLFLMNGSDLEGSMWNELAILENSRLLREQVIKFKTVGEEQDLGPRFRLLVPAQEYVSYVIYGKKPRPDFGKNFPASLISTSLEWDDLVVDNWVMSELKRISRWNDGGQNMLNKSKGRINHSFPCLFYGPSGNGKTLAAQLLGKYMDVDVFKIDLSMVVSKYIGETEKNLATLFDRARNKNWVLFFDEADALFGKRTNISDAKDKWANLEMSYLLQRMEEHKGLTILATNNKGNLDAALSRRFQASVHFPKASRDMRLKLWKKLMPEPYHYPESISFEGLSHYDLSGANIANCIKAACLEAECKKQLMVDDKDIWDAIVREFMKEGRSVGKAE